MKLIKKENGDYHLLSNNEIKSLQEFNITKEDCDILTLGYSVEKMGLQNFKDNDDGFTSFQDRIEGFVAGFETHQELVKDNSFAIEILDDIQKDLANYQNEIGIGTMDDVQWQQTFVDRVIASITSYESFSTKTEWDIEIVDGKIKLL